MIFNIIIKWIATVIVLTGAILTSLQITPINIYLFNIAALLYLIWGIRIKDKSIITVNLGMLIIYGVGAFIA